MLFILMWWLYKLVMHNISLKWEAFYWWALILCDTLQVREQWLLSEVRLSRTEWHLHLPIVTKALYSIQWWAKSHSAIASADSHSGTLELTNYY